jgi:hypothetical protein
VEFRLELPANYSYVRVIMMQLLSLKHPISEEWYVFFCEIKDFNLEVMLGEATSHSLSNLRIVQMGVMSSFGQVSFF